MGCAAQAVQEQARSSIAMAGRQMCRTLRVREPNRPFRYCRIQSQDRVHIPASSPSQVRRIQAAERKMRTLEKSSDSAHTQGLSQQSCQLSAQTVRLSPAKAANSTKDRSVRPVNCQAEDTANIPSGRASPMNKSQAGT